ncbi:MAG TPA: flagellar export protein FliJ [Rhodocyclaceae bacterium]|nr:flagellar export protein FliJ [Rhodocyclaceae bacterium]
MVQAFSLQPLLELMQTRTDEASRRLGQAIAAEHSAKSRLQLLEQYREEYSQRFRDAAQNGLSPQAWRNYQEFLGRIDEAIQQQRQIVSGAELHTANGQAQWREQNKKLKAIDTLSQRHRSAQLQAEDRQEKKQQDELTSQRYAHPPND